MIDHVSIGVNNLGTAAAFYDAVLAPLGMSRLYDLTETVGYGKKHPEFWLNLQSTATPVPAHTGFHVCLRAATPQIVDAFHAAGLASGGADDGPPGLRPQYDPRYYAAFLCDLDGNRIEVVTFVEEIS